MNFTAFAIVPQRLNSYARLWQAFVYRLLTLRSQSSADSSMSLKLVVKDNLLEIHLSGQICYFAYSHRLVRFCVCVCVTFASRGRILTKIKNVKKEVCRFPYSPSKYVTESWSWPTFWRSKMLNCYTSVTVRASAKCVGDICRCWYLPSNGVIAKIAHCDLELVFEGHKFLIFISLKR